MRNARLRRGITASNLAARAGTSSSVVAQLEKSDPGVGVGTLADILRSAASRSAGAALPQSV